MKFACLGFQCLLSDTCTQGARRDQLNSCTVVDGQGLIHFDVSWCILAMDLMGMAEWSFAL